MAIATIANVSIRVIFQCTLVFLERYRTKKMPVIAATMVKATILLKGAGNPTKAAIGMLPAIKVVIPLIMAAKRLELRISLSSTKNSFSTSKSDLSLSFLSGMSLRL